MEMRRPTTEEEAYAWWHAALADPRTPRHDAEPQPGFYTRRYVKNGPLIPVRVYLHQEIDEAGELSAPPEIRAEELGWDKGDPARFWTHLRPITREAYDALIEEHRTNHQMAATHAPIDITETPMRP